MDSSGPTPNDAVPANDSDADRSKGSPSARNASILEWPALDAAVEDDSAQGSDDATMFLSSIRDEDNARTKPWDAPRNTPWNTSPADETPNANLPPTKNPVAELDDRIEELQRKIDLSLPKLNFADGDTLIFIDPPSRVEVGDPSYVRFKAPLRIHSERLLATQSKVFKDLLSPTRQYRLTRRRNCWPLPPGIKFVLDLTPPEEGDDAVELTSNLCCPMGVRKWYKSSTRFRVAEALVCGVEPEERPESRRQSVSGSFDQVANVECDVCKAKSATYNTVDLSNGLEPTTVKSLSGCCSASGCKNRRMPELCLEYSALRHRSGIERVLHAIEGLDPQIDSAPKMWTVFCVAKYFDATNAVVDWLIRWIYASANTVFVEILPEATAKLAEGLQNYDLYRDSFRILVGEEALASMNRRRQKAKDNLTVFGRSRDDVDETLQTRIEYASHALADRIKSRFDAMVSEACPWVDDRPEFIKLTRLRSKMEVRAKEGSADASKDLKTVQSFIDAFRHFVRGLLYAQALPVSDAAKHLPIPDPEYHFSDGLFPPFAHGARVYPYLTPDERLLTRMFWSRLKSQPLINCLINYDPPPSNVRPSMLGERTYPSAFGVKSIKMTTLTELAREVNVAINIRGDDYHVEPSITIDHNEPLIGAAHQRRSSGENDLPIHDLWDIFPFESEPPGAMSSSTGGQEQQGSQAEFLKQTANSGSSNAQILSQDPVLAPTRAAEVTSASIPAGIKDPTSSGSRRLFKLTTLLQQVQFYISAVCSETLARGVSFETGKMFETPLNETLTCLGPDEFKYLPLWAGGNDDGTGGVFGPSIPDAVAGPSGPGPKLRTGLYSTTAPSSSDYSMLDVDSTLHTSLEADDGHSDHVDRRRTISVESAAPSDSSGTQMGDDELWEAVRASKPLNGPDKGKGRAGDDAETATLQDDHIMVDGHEAPKHGVPSEEEWTAYDVQDINEDDDDDDDYDIENTDYADIWDNVDFQEDDDLDLMTTA
ncbi:MAG: hypothetical protein M1825_003167 [Sarcosagium campestre]|nr:MAG: hypothetical protein M1825_003167 [Sarcosagium campestre]